MSNGLNMRWCCILAAMMGCLSVSAWGQSYPVRPIRMVVPQPPGGTTDILARLVSARLSEVLKKQVVVDNRPGASGVIAAEMVVNAQPDGYTLYFVFTQHLVNAAVNPKLPYHAVNDFVPITQLTAAGLMLVVNPSAPVKTLKEFVEWTRSYKGALNYGSGGNGSGGHIAGELYNLMLGIKAQHIPYKGMAPALIDLAGGQYQYACGGMQASQPLVRAGKLRGIGVSTAKRIATLPDLPAVAEMLPGFEVVGWYGVMGPPKLPKAIVMQLHDELVRYIKQPDTRERIIVDGSDTVGSSPEEFRKFLHAEHAKYVKLVKASGIKFD